MAARPRIRSRPIASMAPSGVAISTVSAASRNVRRKIERVRSWWRTSQYQPVVNPFGSAASVVLNDARTATAIGRIHHRRYPHATSAMRSGAPVSPVARRSRSRRAALT